MWSKFAGNLATLATIDNNTWGISTIGYGVIAEGVALIRQRISLVLRTSKRSDPLRPHFGSDVYKYIDAPLNIAIPNIKAEISSALSMWMPEIKVISISHTIESAANPSFEITYQVVDSDLVDKLTVDLNNGVDIGGSNEIILQAFFPPNPNTYRYQISFERNGEDVAPAPNPGGYATISDLFNWIISNWFFFGRWYLLPDKIVLYMSTEGISSASISISVLPIVRLESLFPILAPGESYNVSLTVNEIAATPSIPAFNNVGDVLAWVQINWAAYGSWYIEGISNEGESIFSDEFSDEFDVTPDGYKLVLISDVEGFEGDLEITTI